MFRRLGQIISRHPIWFLVIWPALGIALIVTSPNLEDVTNEKAETQLPSKYEDSRADAELARNFHDYSAENCTLGVVLHRAGGLKPEDQEQVKFVVDWLRQQTHWNGVNGNMALEPVAEKFILSSVTQPFLAKKLRSGDGTSTIIGARLRTGWLDKDSEVVVNNLVKALDARLKGTGMSYALTGSAVVGRDYSRAIKESLHGTEIVTYIMVVVILLFIYRSPVAALVPLVTIVLSLKMAEAVAAQFAIHGARIPYLAPVFMIVVIFGAGTNYCLFLTGRYKEELGRGADYEQGMRTAVTRVGRALGASGAMEIIGLCLMGFASFHILSRTGVCVGLSLIAALVTALTLAPAMLLVMRSKAFWPRRAESPMSREYSARTWRRLAIFVCRRPVVVMVVLAAATIPLVYLGVTARANYDIFSELRPDTLSVQGEGLMLGKFGYGGRPEQLTIVITTSSDIMKPETQWELLKVMQGIAALRDVEEVRSLISPTGETIPAIDNYLDHQIHHKFSLSLSELVAGVTIKQAAAVYVGKDNHSTKIDVVLRNDMFDSKSIALVEPMRLKLRQMVQQSGLKDGKVMVGGMTAYMNDLKEITLSDLHRLMVLVSVTVFVLLIWLMRDWFSPIYMLGTMVVSYLVTLGFTDLVFRHVMGVPGLDWKIQFFLFVLLVAIGEDYNILLMSRVREESVNHRMRQAFRRGIVFTGSIISSCGLIMAGTFASLMWGRVSVMVEMGFAMTFGILLDTFVIRPVLLPAIALSFPRLHAWLWKTAPKATSPHQEI